MRHLSYLFTLLIAVALSACGGGGGSAGLPVTGPNARALSVAAPAALTLAVGSTQQYTISGGIKPYTVFSNNPAVATGWLIGEDVFAVGATSAGLATVSVRDSTGAVFSQVVTVGSSTAFFTTAPTALTLAPGPFGSQTYKFGGGVPPYKAVSNFPSTLSAVVNGTDVTLTALQLPGTSTATAGVIFSDSGSPPATLTTTVTLGTVPMQVLPTKIAAIVGDVIRSVITGGTPPYRAVVGITDCVANAQIVNGNILQVTAFQGCTGSIVTVFDANNQTALTPQDYTITVGAFGLQVNPAAFTLPESTATPNMYLTVIGATVGSTLQVFSTDASILAPQTPVLNSDGTFTITLVGGNTCSLPVTPGSAAVVGPPFVPAVPATGGDRSITITVMDSLGHIGTSVLTVKDANGVGGC